MKLPNIIGHRGAAAYAPENTLVGIQTAYDMGCDWVEFDVKLTKDNVPVLFHDDTLERVTGVTGNARDLTLAEMKELDCGSWFGESFIGTTIPTLEEALDLLIDLDMGFNLEIKPCPGREKETAEVTLDLLTQSWDAPDKVLISSFSHVSLEVALDLTPDWKRGFLLETDFSENWRDIADHLRAATININGNTVTAEQLAAFIGYGKPVLAYTINDAERAEALFNAGLTTIFTDQPDLMD